ncbi:hypothetical protein MJC1_00245 [Methylocystis sp. MJC1]|jgi:hypothetical protein|nr:hypothetical protein MJC1_00245 [Methylocystis sp. MJC1]
MSALPWIPDQAFGLSGMTRGISVPLLDLLKRALWASVIPGARSATGNPGATIATSVLLSSPAGLFG